MTLITTNFLKLVFSESSKEFINCKVSAGYVPFAIRAA
jgi:hypothetical protein